LKQKKSENGKVTTTINQERAVIRYPMGPFPRSFSSAAFAKEIGTGNQLIGTKKVGRFYSMGIINSENLSLTLHSFGFVHSENLP
jgi:hypothetical protein